MRTLPAWLALAALGCGGTAEGPLHEGSPATNIAAPTRVEAVTPVRDETCLASGTEAYAIVAAGPAVYFGNGSGVWMWRKDDRTTKEISQVGAHRMVADETSLYMLSDNGLRRVALGGGPVEVVSPMAFGVALTVGPTAVYVSSASTIARIDKITLAHRTIVEDEARPFDLAVDGDALYWITDAGRPNHLRRLSFATGAIETVRDVGTGWNVAVANGVAYWTSFSSDDRLHRTVVGQLADETIGPAHAATDLVVDGDDVFWIDTVNEVSYLRRAKVDGSSARVVTEASVHAASQRFAVDATHVFWWTDGCLRRFAR
jgi:hypothetical protein